MKILNICYILPIEGNEDENDIVLMIQNHLKEKFNYKFKILKFLPFAKGLSIFKKKWELYNKITKKKKIIINNYDVFLSSFIAPPTSNQYINIFFIPINFLLYVLFLKKRFIKISKDSDIILAQNFFPDTVFAYFLNKDTSIPYVIMVRDPLSKLFIQLPFIRKIFSNAKKVLTPSPTYFNQFKDIIDIELIPHPIENSFFSERKKIPYNSLKLITVSRLIKLKNIDKVIKSLSRLKNQGYEFTYDIVGDGPEKNKLNELVLKNGLEKEVKFHGEKKQNSVIKLLDESNFFILPSYPETLGRSFIEAASRHCICIGHEKTGIDGLFESNKSAFFINENNIDFKLKNIFDNYSENFHKKVILHSNAIIQNLNWDNIGNKYHRELSKE